LEYYIVFGLASQWDIRSNTRYHCTLAINQDHNVLSSL
jgi:hypothetical protein